MQTKLITVLGAILLCAAPVSAQISGSVTAKDGTPVSGAYVYSAVRTRPYLIRTSTDARGSFSLTPPTGTVLHVYSLGFRPWSEVILPNSGPVQVILEDAAASEWKVPNCKGSDGLWGWNWKFRLPEGTAAKAGEHTFESASYSVEYPGSKTSETLIITLGSAIAGDHDDFVNDSLIQESTSFEERHITVYKSKDTGLDSRGKLGPDKFWRRSMSWYVEAEYYGVSAEAAEFFDRILDSACFAG